MRHASLDNQVERASSSTTSSLSGGVPEASHGQPAAEQPPRGKKNPRRACDPCRLRRVKCERIVGQDDCVKCSVLKLKCIDSLPKARTGQKGTRIAQAKRLYGKRDGCPLEMASAAVAAATNGSLSPVPPPPSSCSPANVQARSPGSTLDPRTSVMAELDVYSFEEADSLISDLIKTAATLKTSQFPLLRWCDIAREFEAADRHILNLDPLSQVLFFAIAAMAARVSNHELLVGPGAPSLTSVGQDTEYRRTRELSRFGMRRHALSNRLLALAVRKLNENSAFVTPSLRSVAALCLVQTLTLVYKHPMAWSQEAMKEARPFSATAASHLRAMAEEADPASTHAFDYQSVAWTAVIRDSLTSAATGRTLHYTSGDLLVMLNLDEAGEMPLPEGPAIVKDWTSNGRYNYKEGPKLMRLWATLTMEARKFVREVSQPLAVGKPRLNLDFFDYFYARLSQCRRVIGEALMIMRSDHSQKKLPERTMFLSFCFDFLIAHAHRIILWWTQGEQLARSDISELREANSASYRSRLQELKIKSGHEIFHAARRVVAVIKTVLAIQADETANFFLPGGLVFETLLMWTSLIIEVKSGEEGGRADYTLEMKVRDLQTIREAMAISGWSMSGVLAQLEVLDEVINTCRARLPNANISTSPPPSKNPFDVAMGYATLMVPSPSSQGSSETGADQTNGAWHPLAASSWSTPAQGPLYNLTILPQDDPPRPQPSSQTSLDPFGHQPSGENGHFTWPVTDSSDSMSFATMPSHDSALQQSNGQTAHHMPHPPQVSDFGTGHGVDLTLRLLQEHTNIPHQDVPFELTPEWVDRFLESNNL